MRLRTETLDRRRRLRSAQPEVLCQRRARWEAFEEAPLGHMWHAAVDASP
jgi:hypothetical protein